MSNSDKSVPHIGWNNAIPNSGIDNRYSLDPEAKYYYVHSYAVPYDPKRDVSFASVKYGDEKFTGVVWKDNILATQFHPEKSSAPGLNVISHFLTGKPAMSSVINNINLSTHHSLPGLSKRIIACLDVRANDAGDLVVTKGDQYDVREKPSADGENGHVRNLGKPVELAQRYFQEGADEITFLNITSFRSCPLIDMPMLEVVRKTSETVFVPLTIGGGIRDTIDPISGEPYSALDIATLYFKNGADKISIGSDAVLAAEKYYANNKTLDNTTAIESISNKYGRQAVVISIDPRRVYVDNAQETSHKIFKVEPNKYGQTLAWYQCTTKGGRQGHDIDVIEVVKAVEDMGAGEILLNSMDKDGTNSGFDIALVSAVKASVKIPVIASSGAGSPEHFRQVFLETGCEAALAAGIFHRREVPIESVKSYLNNNGITIR